MRDEMRLNKYLSRYAGVSRREADRLIEAGEVSVDGSEASLGMMIDELTADVKVSGRPVTPDHTRHYYAVYKPVGYIASTARQDADDRLVTELAPSDGGIRLFPVGRLDKDSEGLMILTDDGELMDKVLRSRFGHEKEYLVKLGSEITEDIIGTIRAGGVDIGEGRPTKPCTIDRIRGNTLKMVLTEGMNRQIRKVFGRFGYEVESLKRVRFMNITLEGLSSGECRELTASEVEEMKEMTGNDGK
ncbi:MAG: rRNA pseudouridine synthase [Lachnospiraceae bacterium]|nr:rRNA pseudouridine synthase [Lachnospiraceae bacterium]